MAWRVSYDTVACPVKVTICEASSSGPAAGINGLWQAASGDNGFSRPADAFACLGACASLTRSDARSRSRGVGATQRRWPKGSSAWSARETNNVLWLAHQVVDL